MKILQDKRGLGKTRYCINKAYKENAIIVTGTLDKKRFLEQESKKMNTPVYVVTAREIIDNGIRGRYKYGKKLIIDDLEDVISCLFTGFNVSYATTSLDVLKESEWNKK